MFLRLPPQLRTAFAPEDTPCQSTAHQACELVGGGRQTQTDDAVDGVRDIAAAQVV